MEHKSVDTFSGMCPNSSKYKMKSFCPIHWGRSTFTDEHIL